MEPTTSGRAPRAGLVQDAACGTGAQRRLVLDETEHGAMLAQVGTPADRRKLRRRIACFWRHPTIVLRRSVESAQYTSIEFGQRCRDASVRPSMGSVGDAYDNAMCESFFATLECELLARSRFRTPTEARSAVFGFIEGFYNCSSQLTSRYVVEEKRFCWVASGNAGCLGRVLAHRARSWAAALSK